MERIIISAENAKEIAYRQQMQRLKEEIYPFINNVIIEGATKCMTSVYVATRTFDSAYQESKLVDYLIQLGYKIDDSEPDCGHHNDGRYDFYIIW